MLAPARLLNHTRLTCQRKLCKLLSHRLVLKNHHDHIQQPLQQQIKHIPIPVLRNLVLLQRLQRCTLSTQIQFQDPMPTAGERVA
jgi:hypothetical protein